MVNTYTQIYLHVVFAVSARTCVISPERREELQKYITGIITRNRQKLIAIYCKPDHAHLLLGLKPNTGCRFSWQESFGAFSVSHSHLDRVANYIHNQPTHHRRKSFLREYVEFLERHRVAIDQRYVFKPGE